MISTYTTNNKLVWIDLENPTKDEVRTVMNQHNLDPEVAEDLLDPTIRTRTNVYKDMLYFVIHFPLHSYKKNKSFNKKSEEIDFVITKNLLITTHYSPIEELTSLGKALETDSLANNTRITSNSGLLFIHILHRMYRTVQDRIEDIQTTLHTDEEDIFNGKEKEMVYELSSINRALIYFRDSLLPHKRIFLILEKISPTMFGKDFDIYLDQTQNEYRRIRRFISFTKEYADELRETNNSLLSTKQNEIMKLLAIVSFITFPLTLLSSIFGMNTTYLPIVGHPYDFAIVIGIMLCTAIGFFIFFKRRNWL